MSGTVERLRAIEAVTTYSPISEPLNFSKVPIGEFFAIITEHGRVVFNGDGYAQAWHDEAKKRGLANLRTTVDVLPILGDPEVTAMFERYGVLSKRELESRQEVYLEQYVKSVATEARTAIEMARTIIFPAAMRDQGQLAATCVSLKTIGYKFDTQTLDKITALMAELHDGIAALEVTMARHDFANTLGHAKHACDAICPAMLTLRKAADELEGMVADDLWPLATYQEMLFIK